MEFDFKNNMAILDGRQVTIDYLYKQLLNELNMPLVFLMTKKRLYLIKQIALEIFFPINLKMKIE